MSSIQRRIVVPDKRTGNAEDFLAAQSSEDLLGVVQIESENHVYFKPIATTYTQACQGEWDSHENPVGNVPLDGTARIAFPTGSMG